MQACNFTLPKTLLSHGVVPAVARVLAQLTATNDAYHTPITRFTAARLPEIAVSDYVRRVARFADASDSAYVLALIYLDRMQKAQPNVILSTLNFHRLFVTATLVAAKFTDDKYYNNAYYARIGGLTRDELNSLEVELLFGLGFDVTVTPEEFLAYAAQLEEHAKAELMERAHCEALRLSAATHKVPASSPVNKFVQRARSANLMSDTESETCSEDDDVFMVSP